MGVNLAFGITLGFLFIFFDKIFGVMVNKSSFHHLSLHGFHYLFLAIGFFLLRMLNDKKRIYYISFFGNYFWICLYSWKTNLIDALPLTIYRMSIAFVGLAVYFLIINPKYFYLNRSMWVKFF